MSVSVLLKHLIVALNLPTSVRDLIIKAKAIFKAMTDGPYFKEMATQLEILGSAIDVLVAAETACSTTPPTSSTVERDVAAENVKAILRQLRFGVQTLVDNDPANAMVIITSAAMDVKKDSTRTKQPNVAKNGIEEGTVILTAEGHGAHEWRMSTDNNEWTNLPVTLTAKTSVKGLIPGQLYYFQNRRILPGNKRGDWTASIKLRVT